MESISSSNPLVQYKLLRQVGKGSYGKVYRALERSTNATLASQLVERVPHSVPAAPGFCEARSALTTEAQPRAPSQKACRCHESCRYPLYLSPQAVKVIRLAQDDDEIKDLTAQVRREVDTLRKCDSPFILGYLGSHVFRGRLWLMTEFCEGGSLLDSNPNPNPSSNPNPNPNPNPSPSPSPSPSPNPNPTRWRCSTAAAGPASMATR